MYLRRSITLTLALVLVLALAGTASAAFLSMTEARRNARIFAQHVARAADDDTYTLGTCVRITSSRVNCPVSYYADRGDYQVICRATITVFVRGDRLFRGHKRPPRCETF
jgi:hypothetical protein